MSLSREQMIDYLYGELQGEALARFEQALRESEHSRQELAELQATLRAARGELARDALAQPPARVRDAVLNAARAQLAAAVDDTSHSTHEAEAQAPARLQPVAALSHVLRWLRSVWVLPSLVAAAAAALLVFRQDPQGPSAPSSLEVVHPEPPSSAAALPAGTSEAKTAAADDNTSEAAAPRVEAPARAAPKPRSARSSNNGDKFAAPPANWRRNPSAEAPSPTAQRPAPAADAPAAADFEAAERRETAAPQSFGASAESSTRGRAAAPPASAPGMPTAELAPAAAPPMLLTAARLEQRAREHMAAARWPQAAADYRELLRRFPQDPRHTLWTEQLELALHPVPND